MDNLMYPWQPLERAVDFASIVLCMSFSRFELACSKNRELLRYPRRERERQRERQRERERERENVKKICLFVNSIPEKLDGFQRNLVGGLGMVQGSCH